MCLLRMMEVLFALYFFIHIPIAVLFDSQIVASDLNIPKEIYPDQVQELTKHYIAQFKDPYFLNPPSWYKIFCFGELFVQLPFCFVAAVAFLMGSRPWIRVPAIIYSVHVITTLLPIVYSFAVDDFTKMNRVGPKTQDERIQLIAVYTPYIILPALVLITMLTSNSYICGQASQPKAAALQKSNNPKKKQSKKQQ